MVWAGKDLQRSSSPTPKQITARQPACMFPQMNLHSAVGSQAQSLDQSPAACCQPFATTPATSPAKGIRNPFLPAQARGEQPLICPTTLWWCGLGKGTSKPFWGQETRDFVLWSEKDKRRCAVLVYLPMTVLIPETVVLAQNIWLCAKKYISKSINEE